MLSLYFHVRNDFWTIWNIFQKQKTQTFQNMCHENVYKTCLKLDVRPILDAYNLLVYGETLSDKTGKSQKKIKKRVNQKHENVDVISIISSVISMLHIFKYAPTEQAQNLLHFCISSSS